jgi:hypothetical protein
MTILFQPRSECIEFWSLIWFKTRRHSHAPIDVLGKQIPECIQEDKLSGESLLPLDNSCSRRLPLHLLSDIAPTRVRSIAIAIAECALRMKVLQSKHIMMANVTRRNFYFTGLIASDAYR